jgi:hypothetical protein
MIAQGAQFQAPIDPFAQYGKLQQLQQNQQANALNQMKMDEYVRGQQESNALRQFLPGLNETNRNQLLGFGTAGQGVYKALGEGAKEQRLSEQAKSQTELNEAKILTEVVARTRNVVAGIDPNDAPKYMALRESIVAQYPKLAPYMPNEWNANTQQSLIVTADSLLERQKPEPGFTLSPGQVRYPAGYAGVVSAPAAATAAAKPPEKLEIMRALGYSMDAVGDAAYEAAKRAPATVAAPPVAIAEMRALGIPETPDGFAYYNELKTKTPVAAPQSLTTEERNARAIALGAGPEGSPAFNEALRAEISRMTAKPVPVTAPEPSTPEIKNAMALALGAGPVGSFAYNDKLQKELTRLTTKAEPVTAPPAASTEMKNADAFARLKGEPGTPAYNKEFAAQMARLTAKTSGGEGGGAGGAAGTGTVEVVNPKDPTKTIVVTKARAVAEGLTPAKAMEGLTPVQRQKLEANYPQATTALKGHQNKTAQFIKDLEELRDHPGLDSVTGFAAGRAPGLTDAGRAAVAKYDKVVAKGGFQALQDMRDMSKTGGALGNVSDKENQQLKASFAAIDRKQNAKDVRAAIDDLITELKGGVGRLQDAYDLTYEYRTGRNAPAAAPNIDPLLNKYK